MFTISTDKFLSWKKEQLHKGGDSESFSFLLDTYGGITKKDLNLFTLKSQRKVFLKKNLDSLESIWEIHLRDKIPIQYLTGTTYWRDLEFEVSSKVLIPRSETEQLIEIIHGLYKNKNLSITFADLGTGSGAIAIALALANPSWYGLATDIDKDALDIASKNFSRYSKKLNLKFFCGNWWNPIKHYKGKIDFAISNPPYIPQDTYEALPIEVKNSEPKIALLGGQDGLDHIREIIGSAPLFLKEKGWLFLENHFDQCIKVKSLFLQSGFNDVKVINDLSGIGRFTIGRYK